MIGPDCPAAAALGLTEIDHTGHGSSLEHATLPQLLRHAIAVGDSDPVYWGLVSLADAELEVLRAATKDSDYSAALDSVICHLQQRVHVLAELHRRMLAEAAKGGTL